MNEKYADTEDCADNRPQRITQGYVAENSRGPDKPRPSHNMIKQVEQALRSYSQLNSALGYQGGETGLAKFLDPVREAARSAGYREVVAQIYGAFGFAPPETL